MCTAALLSGATWAVTGSRPHPLAGGLWSHLTCVRFCELEKTVSTSPRWHGNRKSEIPYLLCIEHRLDAPNEVAGAQQGLSNRGCHGRTHVPRATLVALPHAPQKAVMVSIRRADPPPPRTLAHTSVPPAGPRFSNRRTRTFHGTQLCHPPATRPKQLKTDVRTKTRPRTFPERYSPRPEGGTIRRVNGGPPGGGMLLHQERGRRCRFPRRRGGTLKTRPCVREAGHTRTRSVGCHVKRPGQAAPQTESRSLAPGAGC